MTHSISTVEEFCQSRQVALSHGDIVCKTSETVEPTVVVRVMGPVATGKVLVLVGRSM
jgi:hypothetical protein